ncbi:MAG: DoxX family protein [bacterium]
MKNVIKWLLGDNALMKNGISASLGLLMLRVGVGLMMAFGHGWGKLSTFSERAATFSDPLGVGSTMSLSLAVFAEFFCSLAIAVGLITRGAVIPVIITMLVAVFIIHSDDPWGKKELGIMYLIPLLAILITGPGKYSIDRLIHKNK